METKKANTPQSDFSRYEDKQEQMDESQTKGKTSYIKGANNDSKNKK